MKIFLEFIDSMATVSAKIFYIHMALGPAISGTSYFLLLPFKHFIRQLILFIHLVIYIAQCCLLHRFHSIIYLLD